jgi:predicted urease superfamily metal-dependent hydrolase
MTFVMTDHHGHTYPVNAEDAGRLFDGQAKLIMRTGHSAQAIWFGTQDEPEMLRVDVDVEAGRAALRWLPDGTHAVGLGPGEAITVLEKPGWGPVTIPASLVRVRVDTARKAVTEYVVTGQRPTCVMWEQ